MRLAALTSLDKILPSSTEAPLALESAYAFAGIVLWLVPMYTLLGGRRPPRFCELGTQAIPPSQPVTEVFKPERFLEAVDGRPAAIGFQRSLRGNEAVKLRVTVRTTLLSRSRRRLQ